MMKITVLSHLFKWENLHNWWLTKYFFAPLYIYIYIYINVYMYVQCYSALNPAALYNNVQCWGVSSYSTYKGVT